MPVVSVIMAAFNAQDTIKDSINSILNQTFSDFELIIANDGSTDNTKEIVLSFIDPRIILIDMENKGPSIARDIAIKKSKGKYLAILDSDDIALPERLQKQVNFLENNKDYILVGSNAIILDRDENYVWTSTNPLTWEEIGKKFPYASFYHSSVMFTAEAYKLSGGYYTENKLYIFEDSLLWNKMKEFGKMSNIKEPLIKYRLSPDAASSHSANDTKQINKIFEETIAGNEISEKNRIFLSGIKSKLNHLEKERNYHLLIAKKFLWNNQFPQKSRASLKKAIKINPFKIYPYFLFLITFFPSKITHWFYSLKKR